MPGSSIDFFADESDLAVLFTAFDQLGEFKYTESLSKVNLPNSSYSSALQLMGFTTSPQAPQQIHLFLVTDAHTTLVSRTIKMTDGSGLKWAIDQNFNLDAVNILLGGEAGRKTIVSTAVRTTGETARAKEIFSKFKRAIVKGSKKIGRSYVLPSALAKLKNGWRLTPGIEFSSDLDVKLPEP